MEYKNCEEKVCIICPIHGEFWQTPDKHINSKHNCPKCAINKNSLKKRSNNDIFIEKAKEIHSNKYDYSKVHYINAHTKVCIVCPEHGEFWQTPENHLKGSGCPKCGKDKIKKIFSHTTEKFIEKAKEIHGDKYDYSKVKYNGNKVKVCIICPIHGEFLQTPNSHLNGNGCSKCAKCYHYTTEDFIDKAKQIHNNKYDYSKSIYNGIFKKICIVCPEHGEFWQTPKNHLKGSGCPKCAKSHLENEVELFLKNNKIEFECQKKFEWLGKQSLDFYLR